jgi:oligosaccharyltransferase complex subunit alpha (ribophorin I)
MNSFVGLVVLALAFTAAFGEVTNTKVLRSIDLTTQFARHSINITAENKGATTSTYLLAVQNATNVAFIRAESESGASLDVVVGDEDKKNGYTNYKVNIALDTGKTVNFRVFIVYFASLKPFPKEIPFNGRQFVRYYSNAYFYSPYQTNTQRTIVKLASTRVEGHSEIPAPNKVSGDTITYGAYADVKPFSHASLWVHFENHAQFLTITKMVKEYEVSHWGNLAVEQSIDIRHDGAALQGQFSRIDFQRNPGGSPAAVLQITEVIPPEAADVYYRDDIGNISTSTFTTSEKGLEFHVIPRFPLFGGWKNNWYTGYNLPLHQFLSTDSASTYPPGSLLQRPGSTGRRGLHCENHPPRRSHHHENRCTFYSGEE